MFSERPVNVPLLAVSYDNVTVCPVVPSPKVQTPGTTPVNVVVSVTLLANAADGINPSPTICNAEILRRLKFIVKYQDKLILIN